MVQPLKQNARGEETTTYQENRERLRELLCAGIFLTGLYISNQLANNLADVKLKTLTELKETVERVRNHFLV